MRLRTKIYPRDSAKYRKKMKDLLKKMKDSKRKKNKALRVLHLF